MIINGKQVCDTCNEPAPVDHNEPNVHNLRHRNIGDAHLVELHLTFPNAVLLRDAHRVATEIEEALERNIHPAAHVITHLECDGDHADRAP